MTISQERKYYLIDLIRLIGEIILTLDKSKIPEVILNTKFNKGLIGISGCTAAALGIYSFYITDIKT